jgi:hypothetical protein
MEIAFSTSEDLTSPNVYDPFPSGTTVGGTTINFPPVYVVPKVKSEATTS